LFGRCATWRTQSCEGGRHSRSHPQKRLVERLELHTDLVLLMKSPCPVSSSEGSSRGVKVQYSDASVRLKPLANVEGRQKLELLEFGLLTSVIRSLLPK